MADRGGRWAVVSPHLDDGVMSCGQLLAEHPGSAVVTVFAGRPGPSQGLTDWDGAAGFSPGDDPVGVRRQEDREALAEVGAHPVWLEFTDSQYGVEHDVDVVARSLGDALDSLGAERVAVPLGLFHDDHRLASEAAVRIAGTRSEVGWWAYADALYRGLPRLAAERLEELRRRDLDPMPERLSDETASPSKRRAVACYRSQLRALATPGRLGHSDAFEPERYWRLRT